MTTVSKMPSRHRLSIDRSQPPRPPRLGKIRLGVQVETTKNGRKVSYPKAIDYFRVDQDESGITSAAAATAFHEVYGDQPRSLHVMLVHDQVEHVLESAWRLYGASKLKRVCNGEVCSVRQQAGGWTDGPCACKREGFDPDSPPTDSKQRARFCQLAHTLWLALPDLALTPGLWELDTGSEISERELREYLVFIEKARGSLLGYEFDLALVPTKVAPDGTSKTVYTLSPVAQASTQTFRQAIAEKTEVRALAPAAPAELDPAIDEHRDPLISPTVEEQAAATQAEQAELPLGQAITQAYRELSHDEQVEMASLVERFLAEDEIFTAGWLAKRYGETARDLEALLVQLRSDAADGGEQQTLGGEEQAL